MPKESLPRIAAIIYSDENTALNATTIQKKIIEAIFAENDNKELSIHEIIDIIKTELKLDFISEEIEKIISKIKNSSFCYRYCSQTEDYFVRLDEQRYNFLKQRETKNLISNYIKIFCEQVYDVDLSPDEVENSIFRFIYELLNHNITAFQKVISPDFTAKDIAIDPTCFNEKERLAINSFLDWDNAEKNRSIFGIISYSVEYSLLSNNCKKSSIYSKAIENKIFYLDNNILFRAIGINNETRKKRITAFLDKCITTGQKIIISKYTYFEFCSTIDAKIKKIKELPFGAINSDLFKTYYVDSGMFSFYHKWRQGKTIYGFDLFRSHLRSLLDDFIDKYKIDIDYETSFDEKDEKVIETIEEYRKEIVNAKRNEHDSQLNSHPKKCFHDASNIFCVEKKRKLNSINLIDTKYFFISTDQRLRDWDFHRSHHQPIVLLPSQWMTILLKYHSRSTDDYKSFVSFLKLKVSPPVISENNLHIVLSGISEITGNFKTQSSILDRMFDIKFKGILDSHDTQEQTYKNAMEFSQRELDLEIDKLKKQNSETKSNLNIKEEDLRQNEISFKKKLLKEKKQVIGAMEKQEKRFKKMGNATRLKRIVIFVLLLEPISKLLASFC